MKEHIAHIAEKDPFGLRKVDFTKRIPEHSEMFSQEEALTYIEGCDFPESADDLLLAWEIKDRFSEVGIENMHVLDAMCGPGRLGRELSSLGTKQVTFHDGDPIMMIHALDRASEAGFTTKGIISPVDAMQIADNTFDFVVCHNSTHQLQDIKKLGKTLQEFVRVTKPGGFVFIADYQRDTSESFLRAIEERLMWTKPEIVPLLIPTFTAAFSKSEFLETLDSLKNIDEFIVIDAVNPNLTNSQWERVKKDPVRHELDFSAMSLRAIARKGGL